MSPPSLDPRLLKLLQAVVEEYIQTAQPVGSQALVERHGLGVSSATVRNWFVELDQAGYLVQPHTSGGRVPTEAGYRLYVETVALTRALAKKQQQALEGAAAKSTEPTLRLKHLARAVADLTELGVFVKFGTFDSYYTGLSQLFAQPEFRDWQRVVSLSEVLDRLDEALQVASGEFGRHRDDKPVQALPVAVAVDRGIAQFVGAVFGFVGFGGHQIGNQGLGGGH